MTIFTVKNENGFYEEVYTLTEAKKLMKQHNARGFKARVYSDGTWVDCGEIQLRGSNKSFVANSMTTANY